MEGSSTMETFMKLIYCGSFLEERISEAYNKLVEKTEDQRAKALLKYISDDSLKHSNSLRMIAGSLSGIQPDPKACDKIIGPFWRKAISLTESIAREGDIFTLRELTRLSPSLKDLEKNVERIIVDIQSKLAKVLILDEAQQSLFDNILRWIIQDESRHIQLLEIIERISKR